MQRSRKLALFISAVSAISAALVVVACGDDTGSTPTPVPTVDGSKPDTGNSSSGSSGTSGTSGSSGEPADAGADCESAPYIHKPGDGGFFCPFQGEAGAPTTCGNDDTCCSPGRLDSGAQPVSFCAPMKVGDDACKALAPSKSSDFEPGFFSYHFQCVDPTGCPTGQSCVFVTSPFAAAGKTANIGNDTTSSVPKACNPQKAYQIGGTECITGARTTTQVPVCLTDSDCTSIPGSKCTPASASGRTIGACKLP